MATATELMLMEKIVRAKVKLEGARCSHKSGCAAEDDTGYPFAVVAEADGHEQ